MQKHNIKNTMEGFLDGEPKHAVAIKPRKPVHMQVVGMPQWKSQLKWVVPKMQKEGKNTSVADFGGSAPQKQKVAATLRQSFDKPFASIDFDAKETFGSSVCGLQTWVTDANVSTIGAAPWALPQSLVQVTGDEWVLGRAWDSIPGDDLKAKQAHVQGLPARGLFDMFRADDGFILHMTHGELVVTPGNFLLLHIAGEEGSAGVRWGMVPSTPAGVDRVRALLTALIDSFPVLATSSYQAWLQKLAKPLARVV